MTTDASVNPAKISLTSFQKINKKKREGEKKEIEKTELLFWLVFWKPVNNRNIIRCPLFKHSPKFIPFFFPF